MSLSPEQLNHLKLIAAVETMMEKATPFDDVVSIDYETFELVRSVLASISPMDTGGLSDEVKEARKLYYQDYIGSEDTEVYELDENDAILIDAEIEENGRSSFLDDLCLQSCADDTTKISAAIVSALIDASEVNEEAV